MSRNPPPPQTQNNARNEYIPQYISNKPFYAEDLLKDQEYLAHQRHNAEQKDTIDKAKWYERGRKTGPAATKYRKGACDNCGAMTHKTKDCLERPRKHGAKWTGKNIQADEVVDDINLGWDAKRDRWNGFDVREYDAVVKDYEDIEMIRKAAATKQMTDADGNPSPDDEDRDEDGDRYGEETDMGRSQPTSTRQLRLREDTAKYLLDLDLDSAKYDPKTRSMDTTAQTLNNSTATDLASEGFIRPSHDPASDAAAFETAQRYAWEAQEKPAHPSETVASNLVVQNANGNGGNKVHLEANPTASALAHRKFQDELSSKKELQKSYLLSKYGDSEAQEKPKRLLAVASSSYTTYDPATGREIDTRTGQPVLRDVPRSRYPEDVYPGNHTTVFGSWWRDGKWGFRCCHSFVRNSYCTGEDGIRGFEEEEAQRSGRTLIKDTEVHITHDENMDESIKKRKADENIDTDDRGKRTRTEDDDL